jgi:hypothetical protein
MLGRPEQIASNTSKHFILLTPVTTTPLFNYGFYLFFDYIVLIFFIEFFHPQGKRKKKKKSGCNTGYILHPFSTLTCLYTGSPATSRQQRYSVSCLPLSYKGSTYS